MKATTKRTDPPIAMIGAVDCLSGEVRDMREELRAELRWLRLDSLVAFAVLAYGLWVIMSMIDGLPFLRPPRVPR